MDKYKLKTKAIISGHIIETLSYSPPPFKIKKREKYTKIELEERKRKKELYNSGKEKPNIEETAPSIRRARTNIKRIIYANSYMWKDKNGKKIPSKFLTLTFEENIKDLKTANDIFTKYIQRLNYQFRNNLADPLKYLCVPEFQERGAVHYHIVLFNFPFVHLVYKRLREIWGEGRIRLDVIQRKQSIHNIVFYVIKYLTKQSTDGRFWGQKRYFTSRDLLSPIEIYDETAIYMITYRLKQYEKVYKPISIPFCGNGYYGLYDVGKPIVSLTALEPYVQNVIEEAKKK